MQKKWIGARVVTLGCRLNHHESEVMKEIANEIGIGDVVIINTCCVTSEAERQSRQMIRKAKKENPSSVIIVTGCAAELNYDKFCAMPEVDLVIRNREKADKKIFTSKIKEIKEAGCSCGHEQGKERDRDAKDRTRFFLKIQDGCDNNCSYCIVPSVRGRSRSVPICDIIECSRSLARNGALEIVLTGVDITSYRDTESLGAGGLCDVVKSIVKEVPAIQRIRISSIDPAGVDDELSRVICQEEKIMPHLHLSLQSGDNVVLRRMLRRHSRELVLDLCEKIRSMRPGFAFGADVITGFPTEDEDMFRNTVELIEMCRINSLHVFPFSPRPGTLAAGMNQVSPKIAKERAANLRSVGENLMKEYMQSQIDSIAKVLIEDGRLGYCEHFVKVETNSQVKRNTIVDVKISGFRDNCMIGNVV
ncbi:tRNA (N(6)-L-threonylcarbamoyladenosine(37)-C(2))-methylthiotransferase MtaB [Candidatus Hydrogenosomobacter endosymbioticus]|uniref:Threonylcarbamoyladenosine tRNA methylthiotransferase MtaB n=1 Tax=Candidatus Hydrogenosomobacter endosymbioticus TaxID=2558174 RepID=A0ABN6L2V0_9PROT|nr:tRNA (N(6)-L-threonylcarbamoyladenosine(37)-C(2))-methylthiotransferase MtaB [Candidatus Hydrogenosomobacter endosymbioticus]BDB95877.1 threonylcarbamoyladenosine tRNA methylthiotransferase MtaB [Candidatus Hydrogenosomobacter endosymbioticus]